MRRKDESTKRRILRYIDTYYSQNAAPPSVRDVADGAGVALYDDGLSSLKKLVRASGRAVLRSCSDDAEAYPDIPVRELQIQGVAVGVMHRF